MEYLADALIIIFLGLQYVLGWRKGPPPQIISLASLGCGLAFGALIAPALTARALCATAGSVQVQWLAFLFATCAVCLILRLLFQWTESNSFGRSHNAGRPQRITNRHLGGVLGILKGGLLAALLLSAAASFTPTEELWNSSRLIPPLVSAGTRLLSNAVKQH
jgi:uncharacterized membrane protein required for colicin V production